MSGFYLAEGKNLKSVEDYLKKCTEHRVYPHALQIVKGSEPMLRLCFEPYSFEDRVYLYSISKIFTSVAFGICCDMGLISPDTYVKELFAHKMPQPLTPFLEKMKMRDLLSMQSGHSQCAMPFMKSAEDSIATFFAKPFDYEPGTTFVYSTGATCICCAAVEKVTGKKLVDFLDEKLFAPLDIKKPEWMDCVDGQTMGGTGIYVSSNDLTKLGVMLRNKGVYNGKRILSEEYISQATQPHSVDKNNGSPDWIEGYGYQFWKNTRGGFRGDGAYGQLCMVFPEEDTVLTFVGESCNMQQEITDLYELMDRISEPPEKTDFDPEKAVREYYAAPSSEEKEVDISFETEDNPCGIKKVHLWGSAAVHVVLETDYGTREMLCGRGGYIPNRVMLKYLSPSINLFDPRFGKQEPVEVNAAYGRDKNGNPTVILRHRNTPHIQQWVFDLQSGEWSIGLNTGELLCKSIKIAQVSPQSEE